MKKTFLLFFITLLVLSPPGFSQDLHPLFDALSIPGKPLFLSAGAQGQGILWQDNLGEVVQDFSLGKSRILTLALHPQNQVFAAGNDSGEIFLNSLDGKTLEKSWKGDSGSLRGLVFTPQGDRLFSIGDSGNLTVWAFPSGEKVSTWELKSGALRSMVRSSNQDFLFLGTEKGEILVFDPNSSKEIRRWTGHRGPVHVLKTLPGRPGALFSGGADGRLVLWNSNTGQAVQQTSEGKDPLLSLALSKTGQRLVCGLKSGTLEMREPQTLNLLWKTEDHLGAINQVIFLRNEETIATFSEDQTIKLWKAESGQKWGALGRTFNQAPGPTMFEEEIKPAVLDRISLPDGRTALIRSWKPLIFVQDGIIKGDPGPEALALAWDPKNKNLYYSTSGGFLGVWSYPSLKPLWHLKIHEKNLTALTINPETSDLWAGTEDGTLLILNPQGKVIFKQRSHTDQIRQIAFRPGSSEGATGADDGQILRWDTKKNQVITTYSGHNDYVRTVVYSSDGETLASGGDDLLINLWDLKTGKQTSFTNQNGYVYKLAFSPDNKKLAKIDGDSLVIFDRKTGEPIETYPWKGEKIVFLSWEKDGTLSLGSESGKIRTSKAQKPGIFQEFNGQ